jgi:cytochrome c biogenesis protein CcdA
MARKRKIMNVLTYISCGLYFCMFVLLNAFACNKTYASKEAMQLENKNWLYWIISAGFVVLTVVFLTVGIRLIFALKKNFFQFYKEYRCLLWTATILITIPLSFRAIFDFTRIDHNPTNDIVDKEWSKALEDSYFFILTTYLPIVFQIGSLVFGFVRKKHASAHRNNEECRLD